MNENVIVRDDGFHAEDWTGAMFEIDPAGEIDLDAALAAPLVRVAFAAMTDGRGFTIARRLREAGFTGRLRALGPLVSDQYRHARKTGFDEIEIPAALAARQPEAEWTRAAARARRDHRSLIHGLDATRK